VLKKTVIGSSALLLILLVSAVIAPSFINWNAQLPQIAAQVKQATGRALSIDGKLEVRILPAPMLLAHGVRLSNADGGSSRDMVVLDAVEVRVALMPLLSGEIQVERVALVKPFVTIEKFANGSTNLDFQKPAQATVSAQQTNASSITGLGNQALGLGLRLDNFEIQDATLLYIDNVAHKKERIDHLNTILRASSLQGPFEAKGGATVRNIPLTFDVTLGQIISERTVPMDASLHLPGGFVVQVSGALLDLRNDPHFKGKTKIEGDNLADLLHAVQGHPSSNVLATDFALNTTIDASSKTINLSELELQFATTRAMGSVVLDLASGANFDVKLKATHFNLDEVVAASSQETLSKKIIERKNQSVIAPHPPTNGAEQTRKENVTFPKNITGTVELVVDALTLKKGIVHNLRVNAELADGELTLSQLQFQAPGVTDFAMFGFVRPKQGIPKFEGDLEFLTSDPKGLANWLGVDLPSGVTNRLKRVSFKSKVAADANEITLSLLNIKGDRSTITGGATIALRSRPSFGVDLNLDSIDLDAYQNALPLQSGLVLPLNTERVAQTSPPTQALNTKLSTMEILKAWTAMNVLNNFDANMKLRVGALGLKGQMFKNVLVDGTLYAGSLDLRALSLGNVQGAGAKVSGKFNGFGGVIEMKDVKINARVKDAKTLAKAFNVQGIPQNIGSFAVHSTINGSILKPRFKTTISALKGQFGLDGSLSLLPIGFGYEGKFDVKNPDAVRMFSDLNMGYLPKGPLGAIDLKGDLKTNGKSINLTNVAGAIGSTALSGDINLTNLVAKPRVFASLTMGVVNVDAFLPRPKSNAKKTAQIETAPRFMLAAYAPDKPLTMAKANSVHARWSKEVFDLGILNQIEADIDLLADGIKFGDYRLDQADIHAGVKNGTMTADRIRGNLFSGSINGTAQVRTDGQPTLKSEFSLSALNVSQAVKAMSGKMLANGQLGANFGFKATGFSPADLVGSLSGKGDMRIVGLDVKKDGSGTALAGVIGLVSAMNKFALPIGNRGSGKGLADVGLKFDLSQGAAAVRDFTLTSQMGSGQGAGTVDLAKWTIDFSGKMKMEANLVTALLSKGRLEIQEIPFSLKGALDKPKVNFAAPTAGTGSGTGQAAPKISPLQQMMQQVLPGVLPSQKRQPPSQAAPSGGTLAPPPPQQGGDQAAPNSTNGKLTPEEMIRRLMQGL